MNDQPAEPTATNSDNTDQSATPAATASWQSELANELKDVLKGYEEAKTVIPGIKELVDKLKAEEELIVDDVARTLIDCKLGFFASKLLGNAYHEQADMENATKIPMPQPPVLQNSAAQDSGTDVTPNQPGEVQPAPLATNPEV